MILNGEINTTSATFITDDIKEEYNKECKTYIEFSDEQCDCIYKCIRNINNKNTLESANIKLIIFVDGCSIDYLKKN